MSRQPLRYAKEHLRLFLSECGRRARVLRDSLGRQPNHIDPSLRCVPEFRFGYWQRETRGLELLKEWLSPEQFAQYDAKSYFEVTGCHSGKQYRISPGTSMNIHELDSAGRPRVGWCFAPAAAARFSGANTKVGGRFCMKRCGPSRRRARSPSAVFKIFVLQPKKTFSTKSARNGHAAAVGACLLSGEERTYLRRSARSVDDPERTLFRKSINRSVLRLYETEAPDGQDRAR